MKLKLIRVFRGAVFVAFWGALLLYLSQDLQIFPSALAPHLPGAKAPLSVTPPAPFEQKFITSTDGTKLEVWKIPATKVVEERKNLRALVFHGNGGSLANFKGMQTWLAGFGIANYSFDYRGTGGSSGWPSEAGIFLDAKSVYDFMLHQEQVESANTIIVGLSIGTGFAAGLAAEVSPKALILFAPYRSIPALAKDRLFTRYLTWLLRYEVNTENYLSDIGATCILVAHGESDTIIPLAHTVELSQGWDLSGFRWLKTFKNIGHNDLFHAATADVELGLVDCLGWEG